MTDFKVGDWVRVFGRGDKWDGTVGTVQKLRTLNGKFLYTIHQNDNAAIDLRFFEDSLVATDNPKAAHPSYGKLFNYAEFDAKLTAKVFGEFVDKSEAVVGDNSHYGGADNPYEVIKVAEAWGFHDNAYLFNALKYLGRCEHKGNKVKDLKKLVDYVNREIALEEAK